ncbi:MAG: hypothetical protein ACKVWR_01850 [Acidimicrobiales bacterium]
MAIVTSARSAAAGFDQAEGVGVLVGIDADDVIDYVGKPHADPP